MSHKGKNAINNLPLDEVSNDLPYQDDDAKPLLRQNANVPSATVDMSSPNCEHEVSNWCGLLSIFSEGNGSSKTMIVGNLQLSTLEIFKTVADNIIVTTGQPLKSSLDNNCSDAVVDVNALKQIRSR